MANNIQNVGFGSPGSDYSADVSEIERRRALAAALQNESMQPVQNMGQPGSRLSPFQGLAKIFQGYQAGAAGKEATQMQRDLAQKSQSDYSNVVASALRQMRGTPASEMPGSELSPGFQTPEVRPDMTAAMMTAGMMPLHLLMNFMLSFR